MHGSARATEVRGGLMQHTDHRSACSDRLLTLQKRHSRYDRGQPHWVARCQSTARTRTAPRLCRNPECSLPGRRAASAAPQARDTSARHGEPAQRRRCSPSSAPWRSVDFQRDGTRGAASPRATLTGCQSGICHTARTSSTANPEIFAQWSSNRLRIVPSASRS